jgi:outer membrane protein
MKKLFIYIAFVLFSANMVSAQTVYNLTFEQALELSANQRSEVKMQQLQERVSQNEVNKYNAKNLPQITASYDMRYNSKVQTSVLPGAAVGKPDQQYAAVQFGTPYFNQFSLGLKQNIFDPVSHYDKKVTGSSSQVEQLKVKQIQRDVKIETAQAYYAVLLDQEKLKLAQSNLTKFKDVFNEAQVLYANGRQIETDFQRTKLDYQNAKLLYDKAQRALKLSKQNLQYRLGLSPADSITLITTIEQSIVAQKVNETQFNAENRVEVSIEKQNFEKNELNRKKQNFSYLPSVQLYANYNAQQYDNEFNPLNGQTIFPYNYVGLLVNLTVFDGMLKDKNRQEYVLKKEINQATIQKYNQDFAFEYAQASAEYENSLANLSFAKENLALAERIELLNKQKYKDGVLTSADLSNAQNALVNSQENLISAYYEVLLADLKIKKAKGEF